MISRTLSFALAFALALQPLSIFAQTVDTGIVDYIDKQTKTNQTPLTLDYKTFSSCQDMDTTLTDYVQKLIKAWVVNNTPYRNDGIVVMGRNEEIDTMRWWDMAMPSVSENKTSSSTDVSTTNIQIAGVDEADILKTNKNSYIYADAKHNAIYIIRSPLDRVTSTINLSNAKITSTILLPKQMQWQESQLFISDNTLIVIAQRYVAVRNPGFIDKSQKTIVAIYDITNDSKPTLTTIHEMDGYYNDARLVHNKLHLLTTANINRYDRIIPFVQEGNTIRGKSLFARTTTRNTGEKRAKITSVACEDISYLLPSVETIKETWQRPQFTHITTIDMSKPSTIASRTVALAQPWQIHMSKDSLYLTQSVRLPWNRACPINARCMMPIWWGGDSSQTLIHKFDRKSTKRSYIASNLIPGNPLNQYSMEEDANDNFRILTSDRSPEAHTNFYVLDSKLAVKGKIENIAPWESFQSSRYIGDKLYLVTFRQTDPLFVIDIADNIKPKIVGALKIPGYSTYLHPHSIDGSKQYLLGLGYDVGANQRWGTSNKWIQLALYEVDYSKKETADSKCSRLSAITWAYASCLKEVDTNNIRVSMISQKILGWAWSISPVLSNPRVFVMDSKKNITMPVILASEKKTGENCNIRYDDSGTEIGRDCYPQHQQVVSFVWLKQFSSSINAGINEIFSQDYTSKFTWSTSICQPCVCKDMTVCSCPACNNAPTPLSPWSINNYSMRVGYAGDALFFFHEDFAHFMLPWSNGSGSYIDFK